jgi:hypothetical protein
MGQHFSASFRFCSSGSARWRAGQRGCSDMGVGGAISNVAFSGVVAQVVVKRRTAGW